MAAEFDWQSFLNDHPMFSGPVSSASHNDAELSLSILRNSEYAVDASKASHRRQLMCMKESDLIVASGSEVRMSSLSDAKLSGGSQKTYKVLHTPSIDFEIRQICLNPNKKLLAVAGSHEVSVVVLPRAGFFKLGTARIDCKSLQVGTRQHQKSSSPIAKIDWHPWGEAGSTLLVMTEDGKLREYDVSLDPDEPQKTLSFVTEKRKGSYAAVDDSEREVASFTFGGGKADWGPLTLYALMKSGHIYAICPYLPENAAVPESYLRSLECFVSAKEEFVAGNNGVVDKSFSTLYDYQRKYVSSLLKQLPAGNSFRSISRSVSIHASKALPGQPSRQGPFLLQPSPEELKDSPGGDATDITYITLGSAFTDSGDSEGAEASSLPGERLGVILVAYQDGKVDVYLDLEKVEGKWDTTVVKPSWNMRPALTTYETIDLATVSTLASGQPNAETLELIESNCATFSLDPIHDDTVYVYHAFGVHVLDLSAIFQSLAAALKEDDDDALQNTVQNAFSSTVRAILNTYSAERHSACPVTAVVVSSDVYLTYSIFILTSDRLVVTFPLTLRTEGTGELQLAGNSRNVLALPSLPQSSGPPAYVSLLAAEPLTLPSVLSRPVGLSTVANISRPKSHNVKDENWLTPETLRYLAIVGEKLASEIHESVIACNMLKTRAELQKQEYERLQKKAVEIIGRTQNLIGPRKAELQQRLKSVQSEQTRMLGRMDRLLHALVKQASPELNEHETRWFEELRRMKADVIGIGSYDPESLKTRIRQLQTEFNRLMPDLKELSKKEAQRKAQSDEIAGAGHSYAKAYERLSKIESRKLENMVMHITKLAQKLEINSLSSPSHSSD